MSTAMPRLTGLLSTAKGLSSRRSKTRVITGCRLAACTIAQATRWVKETFIPRSFSVPFKALRFASSVSTATVRNEVAVGTARLSSIACASIPARPPNRVASPVGARGPRQGFGLPGGGRRSRSGRSSPVSVGRGEHILLGHLVARSRAVDSAEIDTQLPGDPPRDRSRSDSITTVGVARAPPRPVPPGGRAGGARPPDRPPAPPPRGGRRASGPPRPRRFFSPAGGAGPPPRPEQPPGKKRLIPR